MPPSWGERLIALGIGFLAANLVLRHVEGLHNELAIAITSWFGALLVIVGLGFLLFLER